MVQLITKSGIWDLAEFNATEIFSRVRNVKLSKKVNNVPGRVSNIKNIYEDCYITIFISQYDAKINS